MWFPRVLFYFLPFFIALVISMLIAPYRYAAFLQFWDYTMAALFAIGLVSIFRQNQDELRELPFLIFFVSSIGVFISIIFSDFSTPQRLKGSFINPNEFACFVLLLMVLGVFQYEQETSQGRKIFTGVVLIGLGTVMALAFSRTVLFASVLFFAFYIYRRKPGRFIRITIGAVLLLSTVALIYRFQYSSDPFQYYRFRIWKHSLTGILQNAYLGIGLNMLPYRAAQFIFPIDGEIGRYRRIALSADNQYLQILAETGFLGFLTFLIGWTALFFAFRRIPARLLPFRYTFMIIAFTCLFSIPLNNTSILFLFIFLFALPYAVNTETKIPKLPLSFVTRLGIGVLVTALFISCVLLPYLADVQFRTAVRATEPATAATHLEKAIRYNPYQPYYRFAFVKRVVDARPEITPSKWAALLPTLEYSIRLNPLESDFYLYKARIFRILNNLTGQSTYQSEALSAYHSAVYHSPFNVFLRIDFAYFAARIGRLDVAETQLEEVLEMEPVYLTARLLLSEVKYRKGELEASRMEFAKAESYQQRYRNFKISSTEKYIGKLLQVNPKYKEEVRKMIFDEVKSKS
jgi:O-antigen ligase